MIYAIQWEALRSCHNPKRFRQQLPSSEGLSVGQVTKTCYGLSALFKYTALTQAFGLGWYVTAPLALIRLTWRHLRALRATTKTPAGVPEGQRPQDIPAWANGP